MTLFLEFKLIDAHKRLNLLQEKASAQGRGDIAREIMDRMDKEYLEYVNLMDYYAGHYERLLQENAKEPEVKR